MVHFNAFKLLFLFFKNGAVSITNIKMSIIRNSYREKALSILNHIIVISNQTYCLYTSNKVLLTILLLICWLGFVASLTKTFALE